MKEKGKKLRKGKEYAEKPWM